VFKTKEDIVELLRSAYDAFHDVLEKMQDKVEFGLKVLWDRDVIVKEIGQQYEKLTFKYTGPWPPYNFVNIRLKLERAH
jgi:hypothetical protein